MGRRSPDSVWSSLCVRRPVTAPTPAIASPKGPGRSRGSRRVASVGRGAGPAGRDGVLGVSVGGRLPSRPSLREGTGPARPGRTSACVSTPTPWRRRQRSRRAIPRRAAVTATTGRGVLGRGRHRRARGTFLGVPGPTGRPILAITGGTSPGRTSFTITARGKGRAATGLSVGIPGGPGRTPTTATASRPGAFPTRTATGVPGLTATGRRTREQGTAPGECRATASRVVAGRRLGRGLTSRPTLSTRGAQGRGVSSARRVGVSATTSPTSPRKRRRTGRGT